METKFFCGALRTHTTHVEARYLQAEKKRDQIIEGVMHEHFEPVVLIYWLHRPKCTGVTVQLLYLRPRVHVGPPPRVVFRKGRHVLSQVWKTIEHSHHFREVVEAMRCH